MITYKSPIELNTQLDYVNNHLYNRLLNPLFWAPLKNSLKLLRGKGPIIFARSSTATYIDLYGVLKNVSVDQPRFEKEGLLMEGSSINEFINSENLSDTTYWVRIGLSDVTQTGANVGIDSTNNFFKIIEDTSTGTHQLKQDISFSSGTDITISFFIHSNNSRNLEVLIEDLSSSGNIDVYLNLSNMTIQSVSEGGSFSNVSVNILNIRDNIYRVIISGDNTTTSQVRVHYLLLNSSFIASYTGDGNSHVEIEKPQLEQKPFATSYIPTTTASATRNPDICYVTYESNAPNILAGNRFSMACDFKLLGANLPVYDRRILGNEYYDPKNNFFILRDTSNLYYKRIVGKLISNINALSTYRIIVTMDSNESIKVYLNGVKEKEFTQNLTATFITATKIAIGCREDNVEQLYGHISNVKIWDFVLSEQEVEIISGSF